MSPSRVLLVRLAIAAVRRALALGRVDLNLALTFNVTLAQLEALRFELEAQAIVDAPSPKPVIDTDGAEVLEPSGSLFGHVPAATPVPPNVRAEEAA